MAMRYILRRSNPEDLTALQKELPNFESQLDKASDGMKRTCSVRLNALERVNYLLVTKKQGAGWIWTCPSVELVAENEAGLFSLMKKFSLSPPAHLAHLAQGQ